MTKAATRGKRLRRRKGITLPGGKSAPRNITQGRRTDLHEPADLVALAVRARLTGCTVEEARDTLAGEDIGRCIRAMRPNPQDRRDLEATWKGISAAYENFVNRVLGLPVSAQAASMPMLPEPMQTDQSLRIDPRTGEEKDEAARRVWDEWGTAFNALPMEQALLISDAACHKAPLLWDSDKLLPTRCGALAVKGLASLHDARRGGAEK